VGMAEKGYDGLWRTSEAHEATALHVQGRALTENRGSGEFQKRLTWLAGQGNRISE
jgi:hypothetical protein